jgi:hypothetical protein
MPDEPLTHEAGPRWDSGAGARCGCFLYSIAFRLARSLAIPPAEPVEKGRSPEGAYAQHAQPFSSCAPPEAGGRLTPAGS